MTAELRMEDLSIAYLQTICAIVGAACELHRHDEDGIDVSIRKIIKREDGKPYKATIDAQMKSSTVAREKGDRIVYDLKGKNHHDLTMKGTTQKLLLLLVLPKCEDEWIHWSIDQMILRKCMYWLSPSGIERKITVTIPRQNFLSPESLEKLLRKVAEEDEL